MYHGPDCGCRGNHASLHGLIEQRDQSNTLGTVSCCTTSLVSGTALFLRSRYFSVRRRVALRLGSLLYCRNLLREGPTTKLGRLALSSAPRWLSLVRIPVALCVRPSSVMYVFFPPHFDSSKLASSGTLLSTGTSAPAADVTLGTQLRVSSRRPDGKWPMVSLRPKGDGGSAVLTGARRQLASAKCAGSRKVSA